MPLWPEGLADHLPQGLHLRLCLAEPSTARSGALTHESPAVPQVLHTLALEHFLLHPRAACICEQGPVSGRGVWFTIALSNR